jgi:uncharacterized protein YndB with AHSA1/START domain
MTQQTYDLTVSRVLKAPRSAVWKAWTVPEHFEKWFAPAPIKTTLKQMDLRPGGAFETVMRMENGAEFGGEGCFLEVVEQERIVWTDALSGGWRPAEEPFFTAIITMADHPEGTLYTATALHKNAEDRQKHADMGFVTGWGTCIEQLGQLAAQLA